MSMSLWTLTCLLLVQPPAGDLKQRERHPLAPSLPLLTDKEYAAIDRIIDRFIAADVGKLKGAEAAKAVKDFQALGPEAADPYIREVLAWDRHHTARREVPPLFSYFLARPRKTVLHDAMRLRAFRDEEDRREARARGRGGVYSFADGLTMLRHRLKLRLRRAVLGRCLGRRG